MSNNVEVIDLIKAGRVAELQAIMDGGYPVDMRTEPVINAVFSSVLSGHADMLSYAVTHGVNTNSMMAPGTTLLSSAIGAGSVDMVRVLIAHGADVNKLTAFLYHGVVQQYTHIALAVTIGSLPIVQLLVEAGADVNMVIRDNESPDLGAIHHAVAEPGRIDILIYLLEHGADLDLRGSKNMLTPLHGAALNGHLRACEILVEKGGDAHATTSKGRTARDLAIEKGHFGVAAFFKQLGVKKSWW
jgi:uncharacterized protein